MKRILSSVLLLAASMCGVKTYAAPGDTTTVISHNLQKLSWYENYDSLASFPDGTTEYRKIVMEFELGKYLCDGYDPNNPGEISEGKSGWCADWDYDVHILAMTSTGDTIELGELITPYANANYPAVAGWDWKHPYFFDVTDYYSILKDNVTIRIFYAGWSGGFTATVKFHFIEGTRARDVISIQKMYHGNFDYGVDTIPIEAKVAPITFTMPTTAKSATMRTIISGHGGIASSNCAEFCKKWVKYLVDDTEIASKDIWRDDCGSNWLAVQSGSWVYDRANWCPGNKVEPWNIEVPASVTPGTTFTADMLFQPFTASTTGASYKMSTYMIFYGDYKHTTDASIEAIIMPTSNVEQRHNNPACGIAKILVKNNGKNTITSLKLDYSIGTGASMSTTIPVEITSNEVQEVIIEDFDALSETSGASTFNVSIEEVNGAADGDATNNAMSSNFNAAMKHEFGLFVLELKTANYTTSARNVSWKVIDVNTDEVLYTRTATVRNEEYRDTFRLWNGCYKIEVETPGGEGLNWPWRPGPYGHVRLFNAATNVRIPMPGNDMGHPNLAGNFGNGFNYYFNVNYPNSIDEVNDPFFVNINPNPANSILKIDVNAAVIKEASMKMYNALGQQVYQATITHKNHTVNLNNIPAGIYNVMIFNNGQVKTEKIVVTK